MQIPLILLLSVHILAAIFWAGSTFGLARAGGVGSDALFRPQMGAAVVVIATGLGLWALVHAGRYALPEKILTVGILATIAAAAVQALMRKKPAVAQRLAAGLLVVTVVCMAAARYVG